MLKRPTGRPSTATPLSGANPLSPKTKSNTTTYTYGDPDHPNAMTSATTTGANPSTRSQTVDAAGDVTARHTPSGDQTITYDDQGFTTSVKTGKGTTSYVNDTDGNELLKTDASGAVTLYLGGEEVTVTGSGSAAKVSKVIRYYSMADRQVAYRSNGAAAVFEGLNTQDSLTVKWNPSAGASSQVSRLYLDPYGNNLLAKGDGSLLAAGQVANGRGFLNQTSSSDTGVVDTGLRKYDPTTGMFLSVDPLLDASNPVQWNGYAYGGANPVGNADPSGAMFPPDAFGGGHSSGGGGHHGGGGGHRKPAPRRQPPSSVRCWNSCSTGLYHGYVAPKPKPRPRHHVEPGGGWWGTPVRHAGGRYAKPKSYEPSWSGASIHTTTSAPGGAAVGCGGWAQANGMCRDQQLAIKNGIRANYSQTEFWFLAASYPLMPLEGAGEAFSAFRAVRAARVATAGSRVAESEGSLARSCLNSFTGDTKVTMAGGPAKAISKVKVGDLVLATDPQTGVTKAEPVVQLIRHSGTHAMVLVSLADGSVLDSTSGHPIWDATTGIFTKASGLRVGDSVETTNGKLLRITGLKTFSANLTAYNLQIGNIHTYYAGDTPVLVHNSCSLYQKLGPDGEHLKYGISNNPETRYTRAQLNGGRLKILATGERKDMLALERDLHSTMPIGSEEGQSMYIRMQMENGLRTPPYN